MTCAASAVEVDCLECPRRECSGPDNKITRFALHDRYQFKHLIGVFPINLLGSVANVGNPSFCK